MRHKRDVRLMTTGVAIILTIIHLEFPAAPHSLTLSDFCVHYISGVTLRGGRHARTVRDKPLVLRRVLVCEILAVLESSRWRPNALPSHKVSRAGRA